MVSIGAEIAPGASAKAAPIASLARPSPETAVSRVNGRPVLSGSPLSVAAASSVACFARSGSA
ncbi:MAG: hypothetical protein ACK53W_10785 [Gemmatimonadota bacterium]